MSLAILLRNHTASHQVYAYVTGRDIDHSDTAFLLQSDGRTIYHLPSVTSTNQPLGADCSIKLPGPGETRKILVPTHFAGGRIYFSLNAPLRFGVNPGSNLVEPSVLNPSDPNINIRWGFCELTYNYAELYANISYVDFVAVPIALTLHHPSGEPLHVSGTNEDSLSKIARDIDGLKRDEWSKLIVRDDKNHVLRVLSPNSGVSKNGQLFKTLYDDYVQRVFQFYKDRPLTINTQNAYGDVQGRVENGVLVFRTPSETVSFGPPSAADIFSCDSGPFSLAGASDLKKAIVPRLAAAFNRSTLLTHTTQPNGVSHAAYYKHAPTNQYCKIVHDANLDGRGYTFPYDDVQGSNAPDQSGAVRAANPKALIVSVGGNGAGLKPAKLEPKPHSNGVNGASEEL